MVWFRNLEIVFCVFLAENNFVKPLIPIIGVRKSVLHSLSSLPHSGNGEKKRFNWWLWSGKNEVREAEFLSTPLDSDNSQHIIRV
jgi:hypothetical protein